MSAKGTTYVVAVLYANGRINYRSRDEEIRMKQQKEQAMEKYTRFVIKSQIGYLGDIPHSSWFYTSGVKGPMFGNLGKARQWTLKTAAEKCLAQLAKEGAEWHAANIASGRYKPGPQAAAYLKAAQNSKVVAIKVMLEEVKS